MRIVLFRIDKIGDMIVSTPVISAIKARFPKAEMMLVCSPYNATVMAGSESIDQLVLFSEKSSLMAKAVVLKKIWDFKPTHALVLSPKENAYLLSLLSGAKKIGWIVMNYRWLPKLIAKLFLPKYARQIITRDKKAQHHTDHILKLAQNMDISAHGDFPYQLQRDNHATAWWQKEIQDKKIKPYIAIHIVDKWVEEEWQVADALNFLRRIRDELKMDVVLTAGPADKIIRAQINDAFLIYDNLTFHQWLALMDGARIVISPDCAAVHMACALQKSLLALYQPSRLDKALTEYGPRGTIFEAYALTNPTEQIPFFLSRITHLDQRSS